MQWWQHSRSRCPNAIRTSDEAADKHKVGQRHLAEAKMLIKPDEDWDKRRQFKMRLKFFSHSSSRDWISASLPLVPIAPPHGGQGRQEPSPPLIPDTIAPGTYV